MNMPTANIYLEIAENIKQKRTFALATIVSAKGSTPRHTGSKMLVYADGTISGTIGGALLEKQTIDAAVECLKSKRSQILEFDLTGEPADKKDSMICGGTVQVFIEPVFIAPVLHIFGAGHVGKPTAHLAAISGFQVNIYDARAEMASPARFPKAARIIVHGWDDIIADFQPSPNDFIVIVSPSHDVDFKILSAVIRQDVKYLGVICSKRKWKIFREKFHDMEIPHNLIDRVHAPIGLEINSETPEEIAVSIVAELIKENRREREGSRTFHN